MNATEDQAGSFGNGKSPSIMGIDYIEFYVGNAWQAAHFYCTAFGFSKRAYAGLETGLRDRASFVVEQRNMRFALTSPLAPDGSIAQHVHIHGDGVKDIAFLVNDCRGVFHETVKRGARPIQEPAVMEDETGQVVKATIGAFGDTVHSFIERKNYEGVHLPDYRPINNQPSGGLTGLVSVDHAAISVEPGTLDKWVSFYEETLGFHQSHQEDVLTEYSGMNSRVVQNSTGSIKFPIVEPAAGKRKSQIEEYLSFYGGSGVQHVAMSCESIVNTIRALRSNYVSFVDIPSSYYDAVRDRIGNVDLDIKALRELNILVDRDGWGHLMQIFTRPVQSRPTVFLEVIQRVGARGFGGGNIKALFEAVEREQAKRGNL